MAMVYLIDIDIDIYIYIDIDIDIYVYVPPALPLTLWGVVLVGVPTSKLAAD